MIMRDELKRAVLSLTEQEKAALLAAINERKRAALLAAVNERDEPDRV